jgi:hypothetical protein
MTDGGQRGDAKYRSAATPSRGLAPVNRRGVPTPIGAFSHWSKLDFDFYKNVSGVALARSGGTLAAQSQDLTLCH